MIFGARIGLEEATFIPLLVPRATTSSAEREPPETRPPAVGFLETVNRRRPVQWLFRMPVQWVNRPDLDFRGFSGRIVGGSIRPGDGARRAGGETRIWSPGVIEPPTTRPENHGSRGRAG